MERFVFVVAVAVAIMFGIVAVVRGPNWSNFSIHIDDDAEGGVAPIVATSAGAMVPPRHSPAKRSASVTSRPS